MKNPQISITQELSGWWIASTIFEGYLVNAKADTKKGAINALKDKMV